MIDAFRVCDVDAAVLAALELVYEDARPELRGCWDAAVDPHLRIRVETAPEQGDWLAPWLELSVDALPWIEDAANPPGDAGGRLALGALQDRPQRRLEAMDADGVDVLVLHPESFAGAAAALDDPVGAGLLQGYNRYVGSYCAVAPERLKAVVQLHGAFPEWAADEVRRHAALPWVAGAALRLPPALAPHDPSLDVVYAALEDRETTLFHRSELKQAPHFPGHADVWEDARLAQAAAPAWSAQRALAALVLGGVLDRFPRLRVCLADGGVGWLPDWADRLGQVGPARGGDAVRALLGGGRVCVALAPHDREEQAAAVRRAFGAASIVWGSGFPRSGASRTPDAVLAWTGTPQDAKRALLAGNAERLLARRGAARGEETTASEKARSAS